jgi:hypothetical protein
MTDTAPKRRWFAFSLRTLFVAVTVVCVLIPWGIKNWRRVREREDLFRAFCARGAALGPVFAPGEPIIYKVTGKPIPWSWRLFGAEDPGADIWLPPDKFTADERDHLQALFPEAFVVWWDEKNQRLLEVEDPAGTFPALWKCPQCGYVWRGEFTSRGEAVASAQREMETHDADQHPAR